MAAYCLRLLTTLMLCLGLLGATVDGLAFAGIYDDASADAATEGALDVACNSTTTVRVASRVAPDSLAFSTPLSFDDLADVQPPHRLSTPCTNRRRRRARRSSRRLRSARRSR